jgi:hypothetical protein
MSNDLDANLPTLKLSAEVIALTATTHTLADRVLAKVQDGSYDWLFVLELFNDCLFDLAGERLFPELEEIVNLFTEPGIDNIALPANYQRNLRYCHSISHNRPIHIDGSVIQMYRRYSRLDQNGIVRQVAVKGRRLHYQRIPSSAETLRVNFYKYPPRLHTRDDKPSFIPPGYVKPLLIHYACREIFDEIEDGVEGQKVNTLYHAKRYEDAKERLWLYLGPEEREPQDFPEEIEWDSL